MGTTGQTGGRQTVELAVGNYESTVNVQLWKNFADSFRITLQAPSGSQAVVPMDQPGKTELVIEQTQILDVYKRQVCGAGRRCGGWKQQDYLYGGQGNLGWGSGSYEGLKGNRGKVIKIQCRICGMCL